MEVKIVRQKHQPHLSYVPRRLSPAPHKVKPIDSEENLYSNTNAKEPGPIYQSSTLSSPRPSEMQNTIQTMLMDSHHRVEAPRTSRLQEKQQPSSGFRAWFSRLSPKQKFVFILVIAIVTLVAVAAATVTPVYLFVIRQVGSQSSFTNITASICSATTCIGKEIPYRSSILTVLYPFEGNFNDITGYSTGNAVGSPPPSFSTGAYIGSEQLTFFAVNQQYVQIPYVSLIKKSFTIEVWILPGTVGGQVDYGIFGDCDSNANSKCLSLSLRNNRFTLSFDSMNSTNTTLIGTSIISNTDWTHVAVVYDAVLFQQQIYVNGRIDAVSSGYIHSYQGVSSGSITTIGRSSSFAYGISYFQGRIDHFSISAGVARTSCQIYNDATLTAYYPFDTTDTYNDYSVNMFNGAASDTTTISGGRFGQAIYFSSNTSYFQARSFSTIRTSGSPFSVSLWLNPYTILNGGSIIHLSNSQYGNGTRCQDLLSITSTGQLLVQLLQTLSVINGVQGPTIPANKWTHVVIVYTSTNGARIYINGQFSTATAGGLGFLADPDPLYMTLGNISPLGTSAVVNCRNSSLVYAPGAYTGAIDELRIYSRELDTQEICVLADM